MEMVVLSLKRIHYFAVVYNISFDNKIAEGPNMQVINVRPLKNAQFCSSSRKAKILTTPYDLPDLRGRHEYIEYFEDKAKASLRAKC